MIYDSRFWHITVWINKSSLSRDLFLLRKKPRRRSWMNFCVILQTKTDGPKA